MLRRHFVTTVLLGLAGAWLPLRGLWDAAPPRDRIVVRRVRVGRVPGA